MCGIELNRAMSPSERFESALKRLSAALDQLEASAERRALTDASRANLETELSVMQDDRSRLAVELDGAAARARALEHANAEASRRLERAHATIRDVLGAVEPAQD